MCDTINEMQQNRVLKNRRTQKPENETRQIRRMLKLQNCLFHRATIGCIRAGVARAKAIHSLSKAGEYCNNQTLKISPSCMSTLLALLSLIGHPMSSSCAQMVLLIIITSRLPSPNYDPGDNQYLTDFSGPLPDRLWCICCTF